MIGRRATRALAGAIGAGAAALGVAACAAIAGIDAPHDRPVDASVEDTSTLEDSGSDASKGGAPDGASDGGSFATCSSRKTSAAQGVFAATSGDDGVGCGTMQRPCLTLANAIGQASALGKSVVYAAVGTYVESLQLTAGVDIEGAWNATSSGWTPACDSQTSGTVVQAPPSASTTIAASSLNGAVTLRRITVVSKAPADVAPGESLYGVTATGATTQLTLDHVVVTVGAAGVGAVGVAGLVGVDAHDAGCVAAGGMFADGGNILPPGDAGGPSSGGQFGVAGFVTGNGGSGSTGVTGLAGTPSLYPPSCTATCGSCNTTGPGCSLITNGSPSCGGPGQSGCGGAGGQGGGGGGGGGTSVALYVWQGAVTCVDSTLTSGNGGAGALGGPGGDGGAPSAGVHGSESPTCTVACGTVCTDVLDGGGCGAFGCQMTTSQAPGGGQGGPGSPGSAGGPGGAGAGGWSCATYAAGGGSVTLTGATTLATGEAGAPGDVGAAAGVARAQCP